MLAMQVAARPTPTTDAPRAWLRETKASKPRWPTTPPARRSAQAEIGNDSCSNGGVDRAEARL
eukprot:3663480-Pyramimonas_sp.AAC.1